MEIFFWKGLLKGRLILEKSAVRILIVRCHKNFHMITTIEKNEVVALLLSVCVGAIGFVVQLFIPSSNGFARSGSVVVCIGIYFGLIEFRKHLNKQHVDSIGRKESTRLQNDIVFSDSQIENRERGTTDVRIEAETSSYESRDRRVALMDLMILIGGTLIWGFGDLAFELCKS